MAGINLDEARKARVEKLEERFFIFGGERFDLPAELPYTVLGPLGRLVENDTDLLALHAVMNELLGEENHARFEALKPSIPDLNELVGGLFTDYGLGTPAANGTPGELDPKLQPS